MTRHEALKIQGENECIVAVVAAVAAAVAVAVVKMGSKCTK
jgi:hypothetical protein